MVQYHPDKNPEGDEKFKEIASAYEIIGNDTKRAQYDNNLNNPFANNGGASYEDIFNQMFGNQRQTQRQKSAPDKIIKVNVITSYSIHYTKLYEQELQKSLHLTFQLNFRKMIWHEIK